MSLSEQLIARIRGEYHEMPGLRLTFAQACRLWQVDAETCGRVLHTLVSEGFLKRAADGSFLAFPTLGSNRAPLLKAANKRKKQAAVMLPRSA